MAALVRVSGPPNGNFLVGYPGISATLPRIQGLVEIRPATGVTAPVNVSLVTISLLRRETIHPSADSVTKKHLAAPRKEMADIVGKEMLLFRCAAGRESESVLCMDLPFVLFVPFGRGGEEVARRVPPASLQLPSRTAETFYEIVVTVQQGQAEQRKFAFPVPIVRYDTLSSFGMYNDVRMAERVSDHLVTLGISLPRWSYGPLDPVSVYIKLSPNLDWLSKARKVTVQKITIAVEEEIIYNHEGDEPTHKVKVLAKNSQAVGVKMPEAGYMTNLGLVFPSKELRDADGAIPRARGGGGGQFPMYAVGGFTTTGSLYKIEYFLSVKVRQRLGNLFLSWVWQLILTHQWQVHLSAAKDIVLRQPIVACPFDHADCKELMEGISQAVEDAKGIHPENPMLPAPVIIRAGDNSGLKALGVQMVAGTRKPLID